MEQESIFRLGIDPKKVLLNQERVREVKKALNFEPRSEYYLRLPDENYMPILLFCLTATNKSLSKKNKTALKNLQEAFRKEIQRLYLSENEKRKQFIGPYQLEKLSQTANYNQKLFRKCHTAFKENEIIHSLDEFKNNFKVVFFNFHNKHIGSDKKLEKPEEIISLIKDNNSIIICAYSSRPKPVNKQEIQSRKSEEFILQDQKQLRMESESKEEAKYIIKKELNKKNKQEENGEQEQESKLHYTYTAMLVLILIVLLYFSFAEIDPNLFKGTDQRYKKSILQNLIEGVDSITDIIFGPK